MDKLISKIVGLNLVLFLLSIISLTWLIIDIFILKTIYDETSFSLNVNWLLLVISLIPFLITFLLNIYISIFLYQLKRKHKKENSETSISKDN
jgi:hypothetical protein